VFAFDPSDCNKVTVKLTDYGLAATGTYVQKSTSSVGDGIPFRWMSPEAIERRMWSEKSDVWAWAVTLWEMFTHGKVPYTFIASDAQVAEQVVESNLRLKRPLAPTECPEKVFGVMTKCWLHKTSARPTFAEVKRMMLQEFRAAKEKECCICFEATPIHTLLALVPCGHRCVCVDCAADIVGQTCPICRLEATQAIRVFD